MFAHRNFVCIVNDCRKTNMTPKQAYEIVRKACIEAVPKIVEEHSVQCDMDTSSGYITPHEELGCEVRPIRLADVLCALASEPWEYTAWLDESTFETPMFLMRKKLEKLKKMADKKYITWNLRNDSLTEQTPECLWFLAELLGKKN